MVDERVRLKCRVPLCEHYGSNLMCPPFVPTPDETRAVLARYDKALVVQRGIPLTQAAVTHEFGADGYAAGRQGGDGRAEPDSRGWYDLAVRTSKNEFAEVMTALEAEAFRMGFRFAAAYAGGDCTLCDTCVGQSGAACRHPFAARPSMEAVGIDVVATAAAAGLVVTLTSVDRPMWTGLLLID